MKRNFGTSVWIVLHDLHDISAFGYFGSQIVVVVKRKCSKPSENKQTLITNRLQETLVLAQNTQNNENIKICWKASLLTLTNDLLFLHDLHDISAFGYFGSQIVVVVKRKCSKPSENKQTLITNRLQEAKSRKYQGVFEVKSRVKTWQVRGIWSQQLEH